MPSGPVRLTERENFQRQESSARSRSGEWRQDPAPENDRSRESSRGVSLGEGERHGVFPGMRGAAEPGAAREALNTACSGDVRDMLDTCLEELWNISRRHRAGEGWRNIAIDIPATDRKLHGLIDAMTQTFPGHDAAKEIVRLLEEIQTSLRFMVGSSSYDSARFNNAFDAFMQAQKVFRTRVK